VSEFMDDKSGGSMEDDVTGVGRGESVIQRQG